MAKNIFESFKEINERDSVNGTNLLQVSPYFVSAQKVKAGGHVTMGVAESTLHQIINEDVECILLVIDKNEMNKIRIASK